MCGITGYNYFSTLLAACFGRLCYAYVGNCVYFAIGDLDRAIYSCVASSGVGLYSVYIHAIGDGVCVTNCYADLGIDRYGVDVEA